MKITIAIASALAAWISVEAAAHACACCDGHTSIVVEGWSKSGKSVLVSQRGVVDCHWFEHQQVLRVGNEEPAQCFDRATSSKPISCDRLGTHASDGAVPKLQPSRIADLFKAKAEPLAKARVRIRNHPLDQEGRSWRTTVAVNVGGRWQQVWRGALQPYLRDDPSGESPTKAVAIRAELYPSPTDGRRALLVLRNFESSPGIGHKTDTVHWIELPLR